MDVWMRFFSQVFSCSLGHDEVAAALEQLDHFGALCIPRLQLWVMLNASLFLHWVGLEFLSLPVPL